jgi:hypothetical protein
VKGSTVSNYTLHTRKQGISTTPAGDFIGTDPGIFAKKPIIPDVRNSANSFFPKPFPNRTIVDTMET